VSRGAVKERWARKSLVEDKSGKDGAKKKKKPGGKRIGRWSSCGRGNIASVTERVPESEMVHKYGGQDP